MQMYSEADVDTTCLADRQVTILGYGSQGRAHALNLKDSGFNVVVGLRSGGASRPQAEADGLTVKEPADAVRDAAVIAFLTPDMVQKQLYESERAAAPLPWSTPGAEALADEATDWAADGKKYFRKAEFDCARVSFARARDHLRAAKSANTSGHQLVSSDLTP